MSGEAERRLTIVSEAKTWLGTPYHHEARVKGVGVDCAQLLLAVYSAPGVGLIPEIAVAHYPRDWHMHRSAERYMAIVREHAREIEGPPQPGDVVLWRFGRCFSHGAIVIAWPIVIHAYLDAECRLEDAERARWLTVLGQGESAALGARIRPRKFFSFW